MEVGLEGGGARIQSGAQRPRRAIRLVAALVAVAAAGAAIGQSITPAGAHHYISHVGSSCWGGMVHGSDPDDGAWHARVEACGYVGNRECRTYYNGIHQGTNIVGGANGNCNEFYSRIPECRGYANIAYVDVFARHNHTHHSKGFCPA